MSWRAFLCSLGVLASVAGVASGVRAHTRPAAFTAAQQRGDGSLVLGATWGLAFRDGGDWSLGCAAAFGVDADLEDAQLALDGAGTIVLGTFGGLYESVDGCTFTQPEGPLSEGWVTDVATDDAGGVWAALTRVTGSDQLFHRTVGGSWVAMGDPIDRLVAQLRVAGGDLWRVSFVPLTPTTERRVFLERSVDGVHFDSWELALEDTEYSATLLEVREDAAHLVVRHFDGEVAPERLLRFDLITESFEVVHRAPQIESGAWTDDGLWVLSRLGGLDFAIDGRSFERVHDVAGRCLTWVDGQLAACLDPARDGSLLAHITTSEVSPIVELAAFGSLRSCPPASDAATICPDYREALAEDVEVPVDGVPPPGTAGGCACRVSTRERAPVAEGALLLFCLSVQRRRRRNARAAPINTKP